MRGCRFRVGSDAFAVLLRVSTALSIVALYSSGNETTTEKPIINEIVGEPFVSCAADAIYAKWKTRTTFSGGSVSVRHAPRDRHCYQTLVTNNQIELLIPHQDCRLNRLRVLHPPGLLIEASILISFHGEFISRGDRLFTLKCLHTGNSKQSNNGTLISPESLTTATTEMGRKAQTQSPKCSYDIFLDDIDTLGRRRRLNPNELLAIGTPLYHEWSCQNVQSTQCLIVTNCALKTTDTERQIIDQYGCSAVPELMPQLNYTAPATVMQEIPIFTTNEPSSLYYKCQLSLINAPRTENSTEFNCPIPQCGKRPKRQLSRILNLVQSSTTQVVDLLSDPIEVAPFSDGGSATNEKRSKESARVFSNSQLVQFEHDDLCLSTVAAALSAFALVTASTAVTAVVLIKFMRDRFYQVMTN